MGRDKALLPLPGAGQEKQTPFVAHLANLLLEACADVVLVARDAVQATAYASHLAPAVRVVCDEVADVGPLMGLVSGLRAIRSSHALVTAVDMPFVQPALLTFLLAQPLDDRLLIPLVAAVPQVLLAVYPRSVLPLAEERLRAGRRDPRSLLDVVGVRSIEEVQLRRVDPDLRSFLNINTPAELAQASNVPFSSER